MLLFLLKFGNKGMHFVFGMYGFAYKGTAGNLIVAYALKNDKYTPL